MAAFMCTGAELLAVLEEFAGHKAGLALSRDEILAHIPEHANRIPPADMCVRMRHEEFDEMVRELLYALGALASPRSGETPTMALYAKYYGNAHKLEIINYLSEALFQDMVARGAAAPGPVDLTPIFRSVEERYGSAAAPLLAEFLALLTDYMHGSITSGFRRVEWTNAEQLKTLFHHENGAPSHGAFLDQRFIDYLDRNFGSVDAIHWRNFERLAAEFFNREGYRVDIGAGQGDDGVDLRVWRSGDDPAPMILVQCKRQKQKVGKVIVRSLWADVDFEGAELGLVVTTSSLQPGAVKTCQARGYNIAQADRSMLKRWLEKLRTPGTGLFFGS